MLVTYTNFAISCGTKVSCAGGSWRPAVPTGGSWRPAVPTGRSWRPAVPTGRAAGAQQCRTVAAARRPAVPTGGSLGRHCWASAATGRHCWATQPVVFLRAPDEEHAARRALHADHREGHHFRDLTELHPAKSVLQTWQSSIVIGPERRSNADEPQTCHRRYCTVVKHAKSH